MSDLVFVLVIVAFFLVAAAYVRACGWLISRDEMDHGSTDDIEPNDQVAVDVGAS